jgi:hypothetical protein
MARDFRAIFQQKPEAGFASRAAAPIPQIPRIILALFTIPAQNSVMGLLDSFWSHP